GPCNSGVEGEGTAASAPLLHRATPNPFGPQTTIRFAVASSGRVTLALYDLAGRRVRILEDRVLGAGLHQSEWNGRDDAGRDVSSGVYFYRLEEGNRVRSGRLVLAR
ncbi:MAG: T9SS C-terminal target domain-containing protein, partial [Candidatus Latescibacterota bacterium]